MKKRLALERCSPYFINAALMMISMLVRTSMNTMLNLCRSSARPYCRRHGTFASAANALDLAHPFAADSSLQNYRGWQQMQPQERQKGTAELPQIPQPAADERKRVIHAFHQCRQLPETQRDQPSTRSLAEGVADVSTIALRNISERAMQIVTQRLGN
jgi:hypothetical protein